MLFFSHFLEVSLSVSLLLDLWLIKKKEKNQVIFLDFLD